MFERGYINTTILTYLKILYISEDTFEADLLKKAIQILNHKILTAFSWNEVRNIVSGELKSSSPIDLLITEYKLSWANGLELIKEVKESVPDILTAVLTNENLNIVVKAARQAEIKLDGIIHKAEKIDKLKYFLCSVYEGKLRKQQEKAQIR